MVFDTETKLQPSHSLFLLHVILVLSVGNKELPQLPVVSGREDENTLYK